MKKNNGFSWLDIHAVDDKPGQCHCAKPLICGVDQLLECLAQEARALSRRAEPSNSKPESNDAPG